jgi:hypothetical protein
MIWLEHIAQIADSLYTTKKIWFGLLLLQSKELLKPKDSEYVAYI